MLWVYGHYKYIIYFFQCGDRLYTSESDFHRSYYLTYKKGQRAERVDIYYTTRTELLYELLYKHSIYIFTGILFYFV